LISDLSEMPLEGYGCLDEVLQHNEMNPLAWMDEYSIRKFTDF
jgi:hypothetical protein